MFFMRKPEDLTGKDGAIIFAEYCEEFPALLNQVGCLLNFNFFFVISRDSYYPGFIS